MAVVCPCCGSAAYLHRWASVVPKLMLVQCVQQLLTLQLKVPDVHKHRSTSCFCCICNDPPFNQTENTIFSVPLLCICSWSGDYTMKRSTNISNSTLPPPTNVSNKTYASDSDTAAECSGNHGCKAFTLVVPDSRDSADGYLKSAAGPTTYAEGTFVFIKN